MCRVPVLEIWCCILITSIVAISHPGISYIASSCISMAVSIRRLTKNVYIKEDRMPSMCKGKEFCTNRGNYPQKHIDLVLDQYTNIKQRLGVAEEYESRIKDSEKETECTTNSTEGDGLTPVYYLKDENNKTRVVINSKKHNFVQKYNLKWCAQEGPTLNTTHFREKMLKDLQNRYTMMCKTVRTSLTFMVLTANVSAIEFISKDMPVFCKARYIKKR